MIILNFFGGPGVGKSTTAAYMFAMLKQSGVNCEYVNEYAKDKVWEQHSTILTQQEYILGKQAYRFSRLQGQVEMAITDSPILLSLYYGPKDDIFKQYVKREHGRFNHLNVFLQRNAASHPYNPKGRMQTEEESIEIDKEVKLILSEFPYTVLPVRSLNTMWEENIKPLVLEAGISFLSS